MICVCQSCHHPFWRYRRDWPPPGFCSLPCLEVGPQRVVEAPPILPEEVLTLIKQHRLIEHDTHSILAWFDCQRCEELEVEYGESISYHMSRITTEIATAAKWLSTDKAKAVGQI